MNTYKLKNLKRKLTKEYHRLVSVGKYPAVLRSLVEISDEYDKLSWLSSQKEYPKFFWRSDNGGRVLAYTGASYFLTNSDSALSGQQWATVRELMEQSPDLRCWSTSSFHTRITGAEWSDFDAWSIYIPRIGLERDPVTAKSQLVCQLILTSQEDGLLDDTFALLDNIVYFEDVAIAVPDILNRQDLPPFADWQTMVKKVLQKVAKGDISKVVLSRLIHLQLSHAFTPEQLMATMLGQSGSAFFLAPAPDIAFLGVTPELLYRRVRDKLDTFATARTCYRCSDAGEDAVLHDQLAASSRVRQEHKQVVDAVLKKLKSLCVIANLEGKSSIIELPNQRHFYQRLRGRLLNGVTDEFIINTLHPTPVVGVCSTDKAMDLLLAEAPFDRGLFTGNIGWISHEESEMAVGIRSCLLHKTDMYLYGSAGIVAGSEILGEWEEIDLIMKNFLDILSGR